MDLSFLAHPIYSPTSSLIFQKHTTEGISPFTHIQGLLSKLNHTLTMGLPSTLAAFIPAQCAAHTSSPCSPHSPASTPFLFLLQWASQIIQSIHLSNQEMMLQMAGMIDICLDSQAGPKWTSWSRLIFQPIPSPHDLIFDQDEI